jgi:LPS-assembly protein
MFGKDRAESFQALEVVATLRRLLACGVSDFQEMAMDLRRILFVSGLVAMACGAAMARQGDTSALPLWAAPEQTPAAAAAEKPKKMMHFFSQPKGTNAQEAVEFSADGMEYSADKTLLIGRGNVVVKQGADKVMADYMTLNRDTGDIYARGNIIYTAGDQVWKGEQLSYNFKTKVGKPGAFSAYIPPYFITAQDSEKVATNRTELKNVTISTCDGANPEIAMRFREATLTENDENHKVLSGKGVTTEWNGIPVMWFPEFSRVLTTHEAWFEFMPGYSGRQGAFLLTAYNRHLTDELLSTTHLDGRTARGVGVGQDFTWKDESKDERGKKNDAWEGDFGSYYINDNKPFRKPQDQQDYGSVEDSTRYRLKLNQRQTFDPRDYLLANVNYLSDPNVLDDFFNDEYRRGVQPENRVTFTHRGDEYTASVQLNKRLNDFYDNVDRLPELRLDVNRQEIADSGFYYESHNSGGYLDHVFPKGDDNYLATFGESGAKTNYDAFRVDSKHTVLYPTKLFGWLTLTPRAGYDGTYYSTTYKQEQQQDILINTASNGVVTVTTNTTTASVSSGSGLRSLYELGWEASFKAFRTWNDLIVLEDGDGLRHIAEPYLNYTYNPEPNLTPVELPQFDSIDTLNKRHDIQIGMRNKLQTRYNKSIWDIVDANVWTYYRVEKTDPTQEDFDFLYSHTELRILRSFPVDFDIAYDEYNNEVNQFATQVAYLSDDGSRVGAEYRYQKNGEDFVTPFVLLYPKDRIGLEASWRHDFNLQRLEEQDYFLHYNTSCVSYGLGFRTTANNDKQVWATISLLAFPNSHLNLGK